MEKRNNQSAPRAAVKLLVYFKSGPGMDGIPFWGNRSKKEHFSNPDAFEKDCNKLRYLLTSKWRDLYTTAILYDYRTGEGKVLEKYVEGNLIQ